MAAKIKMTGSENKDTNSICLFTQIFLKETKRKEERTNPGCFTDGSDQRHRGLSCVPLPTKLVLAVFIFAPPVGDMKEEVTFLFFLFVFVGTSNTAR